MKALFSIILLLFSTNLIYSQNQDSLVFDYGNKMQLFKNISDQTFFLKKGNKIKYKKLKFVMPIWGYIQVLDENNSKFYIDDKGRRQKKTKINLELCGTVENYTCEIKEINENYIITKDEIFIDHNNEKPPIVIDSIKKEGINKIYFSNNSRKIDYDGNDFMFNFTKTFPNAVIIEKGDKKGILFDGELNFFDEIISTKKWILKVSLNKKIGYYKITPIKYAELNDFIFGLAKFKLENGKTGYVDIDGKEYYD